jgi:hypothetical protein
MPDHREKLAAEKAATAETEQAKAIAAWQEAGSVAETAAATEGSVGGAARVEDEARVALLEEAVAASAAIADPAAGA